MVNNNIDINVIVNGEEQLRNLSVSLRRIILETQGQIKSTATLDARQRSLNAALGNTGRSLNDHAKNLRQTISNQNALSQEIKKTTAELKKLQSAAASGRGGAGMGQLIKDLDNTSKSLKKIKSRAFVSDLRSVGQEMKRMGKDAQFVGRSLIIGLTTPIVAFGRLGLQNLYAVDKQLVRLKKLLGETANESANLNSKTNQLKRSATDLSYEFGISRELIIGVSGDFAELGINAVNTIGKLTRLTATFSVLGDMDVSSAQQLTQTLYLGSLRALQMTNRMNEFATAADAQAYAVKNATAQMYMFNAIENATALSMREIAETLPEISAAGMAFGLNFNEMVSILAPMKAVGIDVNAAATGIKVSFQKLVNPTQKMQKELNRLSNEAKAMGKIDISEDFLGIQGIGMSSIQSLVNVTMDLKKNASDEAVLKFYSQLFDDRQATRMLIAMEDLGAFQEAFFRKVKNAEGQMVMSGEAKFIDQINKSLAGTGMLVADVKSLSEVTQLANISFQKLGDAQSIFVESLGREVTRAEIEAAKKARTEFAQYMKDQSKQGINVIEEITSESGKTLAVNFAGAASAMDIANRELDAAKKSTSTSIDRIKIAFKNLTATFIEDFGPTIKDIADRFQAFVDRLSKLSPETKKIIVGVLALVAALGPLVFIFGQVRLAGGVMLEGILRLVPGLKNLTAAQINASPGLLRLRNGLTMTGNTIVNTNSRFATFIATLASGNGPIAKIANRFGELTGILSKTTTASSDVTNAVNSISAAGATASKVALASTDEVVSSVASAVAAPAAVPVAMKELMPGPVAPKALMPGPPVVSPLGLPAAGQTTQAGKFPPVRGAQGRFAERMVAARPMGVTSTPIMGELMAGAPASIQTSKAEMQREAAAARKAAKAARQKVNKEFIEQSVKTEQRRIRQGFGRVTSTIKPFDVRGASFTDQLFQNIGVGGAPGQAGRMFTDQAIAAERIRTQTRPRKALRSVLRRGPIAGFMPGAVGAALPFEDEITTGFMQRKFTGKRVSDRLVRAPKVARGTIARGLDAIDKPLNKFADASVLAANRAKSSITNGLNIAANNGRKSLGILSAKANSAGSFIGNKLNSAGRFASSSFTSLGNKASTALSPIAGRVGGIVKSFFNLDKILKIVKVSMTATFIGALVLGVAAAVAIVVKNFDKIRTAAAPGLEALKNAFKALIDIGKALVAPFLDFFAAIGGSDKGASKANDIASAFNKIAQFIQKAAEAVKEFVNKYVVPLLYKGLSIMMGLIQGIVKFIQGIFKLKDNWRKAFDMMADGLKKIGGVILGFFLGTVLRGLVIGAFQVVRLIVMAFTNLGKGVVNIFREMAKISIKITFGMAEAGIAVVQFIIDAFALLPRGIGNGIEAAANIFADFVDGIANSVRKTPIIGWLADKAGIIGAARSGADAIRGVGRKIGEVGRGVADFISGITDPLNNLVASGRDAALGLVDGAADAVNSFLDSIPNAIEDAGDWVAGLLEGFGQGSQIGRGAGQDFLDSTAKEVEDGLDDGALEDPMVDAGSDAGSAAGEAAGEGFLQKLAEIFKDLRQKFVDLVLDSVKGALDEANNELQEALEKQKDEALKVFDTQLKTLELLEKAEESLTKEKEYQTNRRRLIDERELQRANYQRNRALAIYEGRIDDARVLALDDQRNQKDFQDNLIKTDEERRKDLVKENLDYLKESIKNAQEETEKMLQEQIDAFQNAAKEITKFPPLTIEEYTDQLNKLNDAAKKVAGENGVILQNMMTKMKDNLKMPNQSVGVFATGLDQLIEVAKDKYGLTSTTADNTIVGATIGMLAGIQDQIIGNADSIIASFAGIVSDVFDVSLGFKNIATEVISPALSEIEKIFQEKNPMKIFEQAFKDANRTILDEMRKTVGHVASAVDEMSLKIDEALLKLAVAQAKIEAGTSAGGGSPGGGSPGSGYDGGDSSTGGGTGSAMPDLYSSAVSKAFNQGIGSALNIEEKNYLKEFTITSLKRAKSEPGFGMSHYNTLKKNATDPIGRVVLQLWEAATKALGMSDLTNSTTSDASLGYRFVGQYKVPANITQKYDSIMKKMRWYNTDKNQYIPDPPSGPLGTGKAYQWNTTIGDPNYQKWTIVSRMFGGRIPRMNFGGAIPGFGSQSVPALLHGGEYIVNSKAVKNIGYAALEAMNNMRYATPGNNIGQASSITTETKNIYINVENFIGEDEWFNSMVKKYNMTVLPRNQKSAGLENRTITSYNGMSRGF